MSPNNSNIDGLLEISDALVKVDDIGIGILDDAKKYGVDLGQLENLLENKEVFDEKIDKKREQWKSLDVNLADIVNAVIDSSERPFFIIRDDELAYINQAAMTMLGVVVDKDVVGGNFFNFVDKEDWNLLAGSIGEMLTNAKTVEMRQQYTFYICSPAKLFL